MKLTTLLIFLILNSCQSQEPNNGFDNPNFNKDFNESKARKETREEKEAYIDEGTLDNRTDSAQASKFIWIEGTPISSSQAPKEFGSAIKFKTDSDTKLTLPNEEDENVGYAVDPITDSLYFLLKDNGIVYDLGYRILDTIIEYDSTFAIGYFKSLIPPQNENLIRDNCGQWWERNIEYGGWKSKKPEHEHKEKYDANANPNISLGIYVPYYVDPCNPPTESTTTEYRFDPSNKIEYSRTVKVTYKKIEL